MKDKQIKQVEFSKLRHAYITVKGFLESESWENVKSLDTTVVEDLGLYGDDNYDLLLKFVEKFELDFGDFQYDKHFYSEGELFDSFSALKSLLTLSVWLPLYTIELLTLNNVKIDKPDLFPPKRTVTDMTFKDLLIWYIEGKYTSESEIKYEIKTKPQQNL
ncbi:DUF1493 family protein [Pontibacter sp. KCTC 32443]|uniref:DUF1493 family protein n=1 Tax=Pontibacter TaxID=323449 RepID=UPI00164E5218|nr:MULTISPECIES: DUF1493 family protein [Pontibacter]MBC5775620.1 DUF1493 family protein [Pontibacter sp. KCTC 32443]